MPNPFSSDKRQRLFWNDRLGSADGAERTLIMERYAIKLNQGDLNFTGAIWPVLLAHKPQTVLCQNNP